MNWILFGFKRCGKTYYGKRLAELLSRPFIDTDSLIEALYLANSNTALNCRQIHQHLGDTAFRALETQALASLQNTCHSIISVGGGLVLNPANCDLLKELGSLIYLKLDHSTLKKRLLSAELPSYLDPSDPENSFEKMYAERKTIYEHIRAIPLDLSEKTDLTILEELCAIIEEEEHGIQ